MATTLTVEILEQHEARATIAEEMGEVFACVTPDVLHALIDAARRDMQRTPAIRIVPDPSVPVGDVHTDIRALIEANGKLIKEFSAAVQVPREGRAAAYELVERELRGNGIVRISLPYEGRCVLSGRADGDAYEVSEAALLAAIEAAKKRGER